MSTLPQVKETLCGFLESTMYILKRLKFSKSTLQYAKEASVKLQKIIHIDRMSPSLSFFERYSEPFDIFFSSSTLIQTLDISSSISSQGGVKEYKFYSSVSKLRYM